MQKSTKPKIYDLRLNKIESGQPTKTQKKTGLTHPHNEWKFYFLGDARAQLALALGFKGQRVPYLGFWLSNQPTN